MSFAALPGGLLIPIGLGYSQNQNVPTFVLTALDAVNEAIIFIGQIVTADGGSHTIDTTGSSAIGWRAGTVTFSNAGTTVKVGIGSVSSTVGPPGRADNTADVINFDVSATHVGGGGGIASNSWRSSVPTAGTKTINNGDLVAISIQMTARGGTDSVVVGSLSNSAGHHRPGVTVFTGGSYTVPSAAPNAIITFSDGTLGYFYGGDVSNGINARGWNNTSGTKEYGQLFDLPFGCRVSGIYGWIDPDGDCDVILYSDPLGTPVAERTVSMDLNMAASASGRRFAVLFPTPYDLKPNQKIGAVFKPTSATNVNGYYKTIGAASHRVSDAYGTRGYGISRNTGAFADSNSSLDHYYIGLIVSGFEHGVQPNYALGI